MPKRIEAVRRELTDATIVTAMTAEIVRTVMATSAMPVKIRKSRMAISRNAAVTGIRMSAKSLQTDQRTTTAMADAMTAMQIAAVMTTRMRRETIAITGWSVLTEWIEMIVTARMVVAMTVMAKMAAAISTAMALAARTTATIEIIAIRTASRRHRRWK